MKVAKQRVRSAIDEFKGEVFSRKREEVVVTQTTGSIFMM